MKKKPMIKKKPVTMRKSYNSEDTVMMNLQSM